VSAKFYYDSDADSSYIDNRTVAVIGFGKQGSAQALNLRDSGVEVVIGSRPGKSFDFAKESGFPVYPISEAATRASILMILLPDEEQGPVYESEIAGYLKDGDALVFGSGFAVTYGTVRPPDTADVILLAPKGPGALVRSEYVAGRGVHNLIGVHQDYTGNALRTGLALSQAIGGTRSAVIEATFKDEIETDLFGEQAVLCGGAWELVKSGFETLVEAGYPEELAYFECLHELKQCVDLLYKGGITHMLEAISPTAAYGAVTRGRRIITEETRENMRKLLKEIRSGAFTKEWLGETASGKKELKKSSGTEKEHKIEKTGNKLRATMPFLKEIT